MTETSYIKGDEASWIQNFYNNVKIIIKKHIVNNKKKYTWIVIIALILLFLGRSSIHEFIMLLRQYSFIIVFALIVLISIWGLNKLFTKKVYVIIPSLLVLLSFVVFIYVDGNKHWSLYNKYQSLNKIPLKVLPTTDYERPQPYDSIFVQALEKITETESVSRPDYVKVDGKYLWVMEKYPTYWMQKFLDGEVNELFATSASTPSPDFSNREKVSFVTGEFLLWGKNTNNVTIKSFNIFDFFNYFPTDVRRLKNNEGKWVQVVSLAKWSGIFFPHPEFAGVQIIEQEKNESWYSWIKRILIGKGEYISPEYIHKYDFLVGQNLNSSMVTRYIAKSFMFQKGFFAPFKGYHDGDVRIPDMPGDNNEMPYVLHFDNVNGKSGLYDWFGLEPYDEHKHGLSISLWIRSDGTEENTVYIADLTKNALTGMSAIGDKVIESKKNYDWVQNRPVESKPYIKIINGIPRFMAQTTIATVNKEGNMAGSIPETVITDLATNKPIWVDRDHPKLWLKQVEEEISSIIKK